MDLGFQTNGVLSADVSLSPRQYPTVPEAVRLFHDLLQRVAALPGVQAATLVSDIPGGPTTTRINMQVAGTVRPGTSTEPSETWERGVTVAGDFVRTLSIRVLAGRPFTSEDVVGSGRVVMVSEAFARKYWGKVAAAVDQTVTYGVPYIVVGVVGDTRFPGTMRPPDPVVYFPQSQFPRLSSHMMVLLRVRDDPASLAKALREAVAAVAPRQPLYNVMTLDQMAQSPLSRRRLLVIMIGVFSILALCVASVGVYGAMSYSVAERSREIGVRLAIGGSRLRIFTLIVGQGTRVVTLGVLVGLPMAAILTSVLSAELVSVRPADPLTYVTAALLVVGLGFSGCAVPAFRATSLDPVTTLRTE